MINYKWRIWGVSLTRKSNCITEQGEMILDAGSTYTFFTRNPVQFYMTFSNCNSVAMVRLTKQLKVYDFVKQLHKQAGGNNIS